VDVQVTHLTILVCLISAPRRVLMRCVARYEVDVFRRHFTVYFKELPCPSVRSYIIDEETHNCPVGKVPVSHVSLLHPISHSSAKHV